MTLQSLARPAILEAGIGSGWHTATAAGAGRSDARSQAESFEATVLSTLFQSMFTGIGEDGPLGNSAGGMWRSFLTDEYAKQCAKAGGVGIADQVYSTLLAHQEAASAARQTGAAVP